MSFTIPNSSAAAFADQAEPDSRDFDLLQAAPGLNGVISGCAVTAQGSPDMTVAVAAGQVIVAGVQATVTAGNVTITTAHATNPRFDLICVSSTGTKSAVAGTAAAQPEFPDPAGKVVLAAVYVPANDTTIASNQITDKRVSILPWMGLAGRSVMVERYGAVADEFYEDGVATASSGTFTSATANFTAGDVGKTIVIEKARSSETAWHATITGFTNSTTVTLSNNPLRTQNPARFYLSRGGDASTAFQAAIDACDANGGGTVWALGVGYLLATGLVLKNHVELVGGGRKATYLHMGLTSNQIAAVRNDYTSNDSAEFCAVRNLTIDGNMSRQTDFATTLGAAYTAGNTTITLASGAGATLLTRCGPSGSALIGTNRIHYTSVSGDVISGVVGGCEDTTDANASNGAAITFVGGHGVYFVPVPYSSIPTNADGYDVHHTIENVLVKTCRGDGISLWGQSEIRVRNCLAQSNNNIGIRPSFDTWMSDCSAWANTTMGFFIRGSSGVGSNLKAFSNGDTGVSGSGSKGYGFLFEGPTSLEEGCHAFASISAQDNRADGIYLRNAQRRVIQGISSSNGVAAGTTFTVTIASPAVFTKTTHGLAVGNTVIFTTTGALPTGLTANTVYYVTAIPTADTFRVSATSGGADVNTSGTQSGTHTMRPNFYSGVKLDGCTNCIIDVACTERNLNGNNQQNGIQILGTSLTPSNNQIRLTHAAAAGGVVGSALKPASLVAGNHMLINGQGSSSSPAHSATPTFDPYLASVLFPGVMTSNVTSITFSNAHVGCRVKIYWKQDGTGGRTLPTGSITNPPTTNSGANAYTIWDLTYDGTNWVHG